MANIFTKTYDLINASLDRQINDLTKSEEPLEKKEDKNGLLTKKGLIMDPFMDMSAQGGSVGLFRPKVGFITNNLLKVTARRAPAAAIIIAVRCNEVMSFCRPQANRFDSGYKVKPKNPQVQSDPEEIAQLEDFIQNCGNKDGRSPSDKLTFDQFGHMITSDFLRFGHAAIERTFDNDGNLAIIYPLSSGDIYYSNKKIGDGAIHDSRNMWQKALQLEETGDQTRAPIDDIEYVQVLNNNVVEEFSHDELIFAKLNHETDTDLMGYCISPLERALSMVTAQMQVENHQRAFFTHGVASRGILVIQGDMTPNQLRTLQSQWTQQTTGPLNAWRTPVLAGIKGVQWVPLTAGNRDMEYANYQDHVLRTIHAAFVIDPEQTGFGYLSKGTEQRSMGESSNEYKILQSQSKGLRPILSRIESIVNEEILPLYNKELSDKYEFAFVGLDAETREEENTRVQEEIQVHATVNEIRGQLEKEDVPYGGNLILNPLLIQTLQSNMTKGMFMETYLGVEGASQDPNLQYISDPFFFQWLQFQQQILQQQAMGGQPGSDPNDPDGGGAPLDDGESKSGPPGDTKDGGDAQAKALMQQQQAENQAASQAASQFIGMNPHLFKNIGMSQYGSKIESLTKNESKRPSQVDAVYQKMMKDYDNASSRLMKEIMISLKEDEHFCNDDCKDSKKDR